MQTKVVNLFGGPGAGKSTTALLLTGFLKQLRLNVEYVPEYARDLTWRQNWTDLDDQFYIFAKQRACHRDSCCHGLAISTTRRQA